MSDVIHPWEHREALNEVERLKRELDHLQELMYKFARKNFGWVRYEGDPNDQFLSGFYFVYFPRESQFCHKFDICYFRSQEPGHCWGWYPGGRNPNGTWYIPLERLHLPE